jgi:hypothetical protein
VAVLALLLALGLAVGCQSYGDRATLARLYLGRGMANGEVSETDFADFVAMEVTPRFPAGLTIYDATGQWRGPACTVMQERTKVIEILGVGEPSAISRAELEAVAAAYRQRFRQEAVLVVLAPVRLKLLTE